MIVALIFSVSIFVAAFLIYRSAMPTSWRVAIGLVIAIFAVLAYVFAARSGVSPFSSSGTISFGDSNQWLPTILAIVGAVAGVIGSYFFHLGTQTVQWRNFIPPLATTPIVLIPTIKLVEISSEQTPLTLVLLFALSYQNGFFWERLLKPPAP